MAKTRPLLHHDAGVSLYAPTETFSSFRLVWRDPFTGKRPNRRYAERATAEEAFNATVAYVTGAAGVVGTVTVRRASAPTVEDLFEAVVERWNMKGRNGRYIDKRSGLFRTWVAPTCGEMSVLEWGSTDHYCLRILANARAAGRAPATVQSIGAMLRLLVTTAWAKKLLPRSFDPMADVEYVAGRLADDEADGYVPPSARPTTAMVTALARSFDERGESDGRPWLGLMVRVAAFGGLRFGELTALRPSDVADDATAVVVARAWSYSVSGGFQAKAPKNGRRRTVLVPGSLRAALAQRAADVAAEHGDDALLFPGPKGPTAPFSEGEFRRVFERCARCAGWACGADGVTPKGQKRKGRPDIPRMNLRHHAATWLHDVAGFDWPDVSRTLGHASVSFTQNRYQRPGADAEERNAGRLALL